MSPLNPDLPPPILKDRVVTAVRTAAHKNRNGLLVVGIGGAEAVAIAATTGDLAVTAAAFLFFLAGASVQYMAGK